MGYKCVMAFSKYAKQGKLSNSWKPTVSGSCDEYFLQNIMDWECQG